MRNNGFIRGLAPVMFVSLLLMGMITAGVHAGDSVEPNIFIQEAKDEVLIILDLFPMEKKLAGFDEKDLQEYILRESLRQMFNAGFKNDPKSKLIKIQVVRLAEQDDYGQPDWTSVEEMAHLEITPSFEAGISFKELKNKNITELMKLFTKVEFTGL